MGAEKPFSVSVLAVQGAYVYQACIELSGDRSWEASSAIGRELVLASLLALL